MTDSRQQEQQDQRDKRERLDALIQTFNEAMLVTHTRQGVLQARPMLTAGAEGAETLWFIANAGSEKVAQVLHDERALVVMQAQGRYLSISGRCDVVPD